MCRFLAVFAALLITPLITPFSTLASAQALPPTTAPTTAPTPAPTTAPTPTPTTAPPPPPAFRPALDARGFSVFPVARDARVIYVSSSAGDDRYPGLTTTAPLKTFDRAKRFLRDGYPDRILLRAGDTFPPLGNLAVSGRSPAEPVVIGVFGDGPRPRVEAHEHGIGFDGRREIRHLAVVGIEFTNPRRDINDPRFDPEAVVDGRRVIDYDSFVLRVLTQGASHLTFEDCVFRAFREGPQFFGIHVLTLRRNLFLDAWSDKGKAQGLYIDTSSDVLIEENLFDHNGWARDAVVAKYPGAAANIFNHNLYAQDANAPPPSGMRVVGNLFARGASHGAQVRCGGLLEDNLFLDNAIAGFVAGGRSGEAPATIRLNVVLGGRDISPELRRGWGLSVIASPVVVFEHNLVAHRSPGVGDAWPYELQYDPGRPPPVSVTWHNNAAHRWGGDTTSNRAHVPGTFPVVTSGFPDPTRTLDAYCRENNLPDLLAAARNRPRGTWPPELSPRVINAWLRAGFLPPLNPP